MLSKYSARRPLTISIMTSLIIIIGIICAFFLRAELVPADGHTVTIYTQLPGGSPDMVEKQVTEPLEQTISAIGAVRSTSSVSSAGESVIYAEIRRIGSVSRAIDEIKTALSLTVPTLGAGVSAPVITSGRTDRPVIVTAVTCSTWNSTELTRYLTEDIIPELKKIKGVAEVAADGTTDRWVSVTISANKISDVNNSIRSEINNSFAATQAVLDQTSQQLQSARITMLTELEQQQMQITANSSSVSSSITALQSAISTLGDKNTLIANRDDLSRRISSIDALLDLMGPSADAATVEALNADKEALIGSLSAYQSTIDSIESMEKQIAELQASQSTISSDNSAISQKLAETKENLDKSQAELDQQYAQLKVAREQAMAKSDVSSYITSSIIRGVLSSGSGESSLGYIPSSSGSIPVSVGDYFSSIEELSSTVIADLGIEGMDSIILSDVADITIEDNNSTSLTTLDGANCIMLTVSLEDNARAGIVSERVRRLYEEHTGDQAYLSFDTLRDDASARSASVSTLLYTMLAALAAILLILPLFLRRVRCLGTVAASIPVSLAFAVAAMYLSGISLNIYSLAALIAAAGIMVCASIVVTENIYALRSAGYDNTVTAFEGASQMAGILLASFLSGVCVFLPILLTRGISYRICSDVGLTLLYCMLGSIFTALTLVPLLSKRTLDRVGDIGISPFDRISIAYYPALRASFDLRLPIIIVAVALLALGITGIKFMGLSSLSKDETDTIKISLIMDDAAPESDQEGIVPEELDPNSIYNVSSMVSDRIRELTEVETLGIYAPAGSAPASSSTPERLTMYARLTDDCMKTNEEMCALIELCGGGYPCTLVAEPLIADSSEVDADTQGSITVTLRGDNNDSLVSAYREVCEMLDSVFGLEEVDESENRIVSELHLAVSKSSAVEYGMTAADVAAAITEASAAHSDATAAIVLVDNSDYYPVRISDNRAGNLSSDSIASMVVGTVTDGNGVSSDVTLGSVADITYTDAFAEIHHDNGERYLTVSTSIMEGFEPRAVMRDTELAFMDYESPYDVNITVSRSTAPIVALLIRILIALAAALILIYIVLAVKFQSMRLPFAVLSIVPLSFAGGLIALWITGSHITVMGAIGFLILTAMVVVNTVPIVDLFRLMRLDAVPTKDAALSASQIRLRPVVMSYIAEMLASLALALGIAPNSYPTQPTGIVLLGGLILALPLTLFITPILLYTFGGDAVTAPKRLVRPIIYPLDAAPPLAPEAMEMLSGMSGQSDAGEDDNENGSDTDDAPGKQTDAEEPPEYYRPEPIEPVEPLILDPIEPVEPIYGGVSLPTDEDIDMFDEEDTPSEDDPDVVKDTSADDPDDQEDLFDDEEDTPSEDAADEGESEPEEAPDEGESEPEEAPDKGESEPEKAPDEDESEPEEAPDEGESEPEKAPDEDESVPEEAPDEDESEPEEAPDEDDDELGENPYILLTNLFDDDEEDTASEETNEIEDAYDDDDLDDFDDFDDFDDDDLDDDDLDDGDLDDDDLDDDDLDDDDLDDGDLDDDFEDDLDALSDEMFDDEEETLREQASILFDESDIEITEEISAPAVDISDEAIPEEEAPAEEEIIPEEVIPAEDDTPIIAEAETPEEAKNSEDDDGGDAEKGGFDGGIDFGKGNLYSSFDMFDFSEDNSFEQ